MSNYLQFSISLTDSLQSDILVARLTAMGFLGFEETDYYLHAYVEEQEFRSEEFESLLLEQNLQVSTKTISSTNWNAEWEKNFQPVILGKYCAIRAGFHQPILSVEHEIVITPKMSFGTGHHATTCLMIGAMSGLDFEGKRVLDFGTGTGVLSILAEKSGSSDVLAIDSDSNCVENARENISENHCRRIEVFKTDTLAETGSFDVILANLNRNTLLENMGEIRQHLTPEGVLLMSGLLAEDVQEVSEVASKMGLIVVTVELRDNWACIEMKKASEKESEL